MVSAMTFLIRFNLVFHRILGIFPRDCGKNNYQLLLELVDRRFERL